MENQYFVTQKQLCCNMIELYSGKLPKYFSGDVSRFDATDA